MKLNFLWPSCGCVRCICSNKTKKYIHRLKLYPFYRRGEALTVTIQETPPPPPRRSESIPLGPSFSSSAPHPFSSSRPTVSYLIPLHHMTIAIPLVCQSNQRSKRKPIWGYAGVEEDIDFRLSIGRTYSLSWWLDKSHHRSLDISYTSTRYFKHRVTYGLGVSGRASHKSDFNLGFIRVQQSPSGRQQKVEFLGTVLQRPSSFLDPHQSDKEWLAITTIKSLWGTNQANGKCINKSIN